MTSAIAILTNIDINAHRRNGLTDDQIALEMDLPVTTIKSIPFPKPQPARQRAAQAMQLQTAIQMLMPKVEAGDVEAIQTMLKVQKREADLLGLDAPKETISRNFNTDVTDVTAISTDDLKRMVLEHLNQTTIDVTPETAPDDDPDSQP